MSDELLLSVTNLTKRFGGVCALEDVTLEVSAGQLTGLIGPNGSGKTTAFNLITAVLRSTRGQILFRGRDVSRSRPDRNAALGMSRTFQNIRLFPELPAVDNVAVGMHMRHGSGFWASLSALPRVVQGEWRIRERAGELLGLFGLAGRKGELVANLPYGDQRKVELARALATDPALLLLDEPSAGMNPIETQELSSAIQTINNEYGVTVLLVEHDMKLVMQICERILVLNQGQLLASGTPEAIQTNPGVIEAYLGPGSRAGHA